VRRTDIFRTAAGLAAVILLAVAVTAISAKPPILAEKPVSEARTASRPAQIKTNDVGIAAQAVSGSQGTTLTAAADYALPWYSFNGGGVLTGGSPTHGLGDAIGQSFAGRGSSPSYGLEFGFFAGTAICSCPNQGDFDEDGFVNALDLGAMIDVAFAGAPDLRDSSCPTTRMDFDCNGFSDALDLGGYVDYVFAGGPPPCAPCTDM